MDLGDKRFVFRSDLDLDPKAGEVGSHDTIVVDGACCLLHGSLIVDG